MTRLLHVVGLTLLVLAPMISSAKAIDHGKSQIRGRDITSIPRRLQFSDYGDSYGEGSVSPTASPSATSSPATSMTTSTCSNGITGIESSNGLACCVAGCGQCGGVGCSTVGLPEYDADDCCSTEIVDFGMSCSVTGSAPCYISDDEAVCSNGVVGVESADGTICCASECDECSEDACSLSYDFGTDGENDCCSSDVADVGELCDSTGVSPCVISEVASTCSNGITGIESSNGEACCVAACGQCGGVGCSTAGLPNYDAYDCCVTEIVEFGLTCSDTGSAPCYIYESQTASSDTPTPTTSAMFTSAFTMSPTVTETASCIESYTYVGCYSEMTEDPFYIKYASVNMTTQACFTTCSGEDAIYMGLMSGNECGCGENGLYLVLNKTEGSCTSACSGDAEQTCGGPLSFDLYTISEICD